MIILHRLNDSEFVLNASHIEVVDETPDTVITLTNGKKYIVKENAKEVIRLTVEYNRKIYGRILAD